MKELFYQIALRQTDYIGDILAKNLVNAFGSASAVFQAAESELKQQPHLTEAAIRGILGQKAFSVADRELNFIEKNQVQPLFFKDDNYPKRLRQLENAPFLLFYKGKANLNLSHTVSVVGTRKPTEWGKTQCERLITGLAAYNPLIISGLAYGVDFTAHRKAVDLGLATVGVVAHGLDMIYPAAHSSLAEKMQEKGGILTEFITQTEPNREHFPMRNRIIAALAQAVVVVETARTGGSIITAELANDYQKDVFAIPGRVDDEYSQGCNWLIKTHKASLLESWEDLIYVLRWDKQAQQQAAQPQLFVELNPEESKIVEILRGSGQVHLDILLRQSGLSVSKLAGLLLDLEFKSIVKPLAGKNYILY